MSSVIAGPNKDGDPGTRGGVETRVKFGRDVRELGRAGLRNLHHIDLHLDAVGQGIDECRRICRIDFQDVQFGLWRDAAQIAGDRVRTCGNQSCAVGSVAGFVTVPVFGMAVAREVKAVLDVAQD